MKKILLIVLGTVLLTGISFAKPNRALTIDPIDFLNSDRINLKYEQMLQPKRSFTVELLYLNEDNNTNGFGIGGAYRWYSRAFIPVKTTGVEGLSYGTYMRMNWLRRKLNDDSYDNQAGVDIGGEIAYKFVLGKHFVFEPMIRIGYGWGGPAFSNHEGIKPWPGINIGLAW